MPDTAPLLRALMRRQFTAVNQQFTHILTLQAWGEDELADRITEVDNVDFATSMQIMDLLVRRGLPLDIPSESFAPGAHLAEILMAEAAMEDSLHPLIEDMSFEDAEAQALIEAIRAPRADYRQWLQAQIEADQRPPSDLPDRHPETAGLYGYLMVMLEQSMAHAFIHWHRGTEDEADICWAASGEAMVLGTAIDRRLALLGTTPRPSEDLPALNIAESPSNTHAADRALAEGCAAEARQAAELCREPKLARLCTKIADYAERLAAWRLGDPHPAVGRHPAFTSFARSRARIDLSDQQAA